MILIIGAMNEEVQAMTSRMFQVQERIIRGIECVQGVIHGRSVLVVLSGIGKVNAAYTAATLLASEPIESVLNIGSAGGLNQNQQIGDLIVATRCVMHDFDIQNGYGSDPRFIAEPSLDLQAKAVQVMHSQHLRVHQGLLVSGDQFITNEDRFQVIKERLPEAIAVDMESYAIGAVCQRAFIPFLIVRALSDLAFTTGNAVAFDVYLKQASEQSAQFCACLISEL